MPESIRIDRTGGAKPSLANVEIAGRKRSKPMKERMRIGRACDYCKKKKIRCAGEQPCQHCVKEKVSCEYNAPYARGKRRSLASQGETQPLEPPIPSLHGSSTHSSLPSHEEGGSPQISRFGNDVNNAPRQAEPPNQSIISLRVSPESDERDQQGHFVGASSWLSFLLRLQRRLRRNAADAPATTLFSLGDAALPPFDAISFVPPPRHQAEALFTTYFELSSPTYRFLHRPTVERWLNQIYEHGHVLEDQPHSKYAVVLSIFSQAVQYKDNISIRPNSNTGIEFFQAAEGQLSLGNEPATLTSVQALLGCCFHLLTRSRLNHCWTLFGTTARLILALGLHRKRSHAKHCGKQTDLIQQECGKRLFWCAYNLDKYLSSIFGRPCALNDDDIDQDMPSVVEDDQLSSDWMQVSSKSNMNIMLGPLAHQKLGRILSSTLRQLYGRRRLTKSARYQTMSELGDQVEGWRRELPAFLNPDKVDSRLLIPLFRRQSNLLSLASGHAEILIYRSCLFNDHQQGTPDGDCEGTRDNVQRCVRAAMMIAGIIDLMVEAGQYYAASWFSHYQAFCAVVILYAYTIRSRHADPSSWLEYFRAAERCQNSIATVANLDSLVQRFSVIMEEFRLQVVTQVQRDSPLANVLNDETPSYQCPENVLLAGELYNPSTEAWPANAHPVDQLDIFGLPDWEQLDSLALDLSNIVPSLGPLS